MRQADPRFDMTPKGRELFAAAVAREMEFIARHGYVEFQDDFNRTQRIYTSAARRRMNAARAEPATPGVIGASGQTSLK